MKALLLAVGIILLSPSLVVAAEFLTSLRTERRMLATRPPVLLGGHRVMRAVDTSDDELVDISLDIQERENQFPPITSSMPFNRRTDVSLLGWIPYWDQESAFASFRDHADLFDTVAFFWYRLDSQGNIATYDATEEDLSMIDYAHRHGVKALFIIANLPDYTEGGTWDPQRVDRVIATPQARARHVSDLVTLTEDRGFDGINIDYESLETSQRDNFTLFIRDLGKALRARGKILGVAIHPKTSESKPDEDNGSRAQDLRALARYADHLYFMTYGEHWTESKPGPIASPQWINKVVKYAVTKQRVPKDKVYVGLPLYAGVWREDRSNVYSGIEVDWTLQKATAVQKKYSSLERRHRQSQSPYFVYQKEGQRYIVWLEDERSLSKKVSDSQQQGINHFAFWRLGGETPEVWRWIEELKIKEPK